MGRFIDCGELRETNGEGFNPSAILTMKNGVFKGDFVVTSDMVKDCKLNFPIEMKEVSGRFDCSVVKLTTLEGAPKEVGGNFYCSGNELTNLEGAPEKVGLGFMCHHNKLTSLEGAPKEVGGNFDCSYNTRRFTEEEVRAVCDVKGRVIV